MRRGGPQGRGRAVGQEERVIPTCCLRRASQSRSSKRAGEIRSGRLQTGIIGPRLPLVRPNREGASNEIATQENDGRGDQPASQDGPRAAASVSPGVLAHKERRIDASKSYDHKFTSSVS